MTPNGRFELHKKICLSISGYHPETWRPSWSIRTALLAMIGFMPTHGNGAIGSLDYTDAERRILTKRSVDYVCKVCGPIKNLLLDKPQDQAEEQEEIKKYSSQLTTSKPSNSSGESSTDKNENETSQEEASSPASDLTSEINIDPATDPTETKEDENEVIQEEENSEELIEEVEISRPRRENDLASFVLMWFLVLALAFIIYRRLNKSLGIDLVELADQYLTSLLP
ncbi:unnamed protein product [Oikopleura dioica]|nr:unnamed protein product [Oikopleura dioica]